MTIQKQVKDLQRSDIEAYRIAYGEAQGVADVWHAATWGPYPIATIGGVLVRDMSARDLRTVHLTMPLALSGQRLDFGGLLNLVWYLSLEFVESDHREFKQRHRAVARALRQSLDPRGKIWPWQRPTAQEKLAALTRGLDAANEDVRLYLKRHFLYSTPGHGVGIASHSYEAQLIRAAGEQGGSFSADALSVPLPRLLESLDCARPEERINPIHFDLQTRFDGLMSLCRDGEIKASEIDPAAWEIVNKWRKEWGVKHG